MDNTKFSPSDKQWWTSSRTYLLERWDFYIKFVMCVCALNFEDMLFRLAVVECLPSKCEALSSKPQYIDIYSQKKDSIDPSFRLSLREWSLVRIDCLFMLGEGNTMQLKVSSIKNAFISPSQSECFLYYFVTLCFLCICWFDLRTFML
jgi:hypothetical protein